MRLIIYNKIKIFKRYFNSNINIRNTLSLGSTTFPSPSTSSSTSTSSLNTTDNNNNNHSHSHSKYNWYACGPTVYDDSHLGHARTYINTDIIRRILTDYFKYEIHFAMGMTDIDDKIIKRAEEKQVNWKDLAREYETKFIRDMDLLGIKRPETILRVTEHIPDIINYITKIQENGAAYQTETGVYFNVPTSSSYGKLGNIPVGEEDPEADITNLNVLRGKKDPRDFALWKLVDESKPHWNSPWGKGRPGWHIECSAMSHAYFGSSVHIHSGGIDLRFPHHTNEIAQSEAHNCSCKWVDYWIHTGHLYIDGYKMSKSLKNFITIDNYLHGRWSGTETRTQNPLIQDDQTFINPLFQDTLTASADLRIFFLQHKYHSSLYFSENSLKEAINWRKKIEGMLQLTHPINLSNQTKNDNSDNSNNNSGNNGNSGNSNNSNNSNNNDLNDKRSKRMSNESKELLNYFLLTKQDIHNALKDDFNTPVVLLHLLKLSTQSTSYLMQYPLQSENYSFDPIPTIRDYVIDIIKLFGLVIHEEKYNHSNIVHIQLHGSKVFSSSSSLSSNSVPVTSLMDDYNNYRGKVRAKTLKSFKELKKLKKSLNELKSEIKNESNEKLSQLITQYEEHFQDILNLSDDVRNNLLKQGIEINDLNDKSIWKYTTKK